MILRIKVKNYKSIKEEDISLNKFNVIFGKNGSGKTNFISAIHMLKNLALGDDLENIIGGKIAPLSNEFFNCRNQANVASFEFTLESKSKNIYLYSYEINFARNFGKFSISSESLRKISNDRDESIYKRIKEISYAGPNNHEIPFKTEPTKLMLSSYSDEDVLEVVNILRGSNFIDTSFEEKEGLTIVQGNRPNSRSIDGVAVSLFIKNGGRFTAAVKSIQKIITNFASPNVTSLEERANIQDQANQKNEDEIKRYFVTWHELDANVNYSHLSLSNGDRRVIHLIFNLFNSEENSFLSVEEIENGMHYGRISRLMDELRTQANNRNIQILMTTHSNEILNSVTAQEVIYCHKDIDSGTKLIHVKDTHEYDLIKEDLMRDPTAVELINSGFFNK